MFGSITGCLGSACDESTAFCTRSAVACLTGPTCAQEVERQFLPLNRVSPTSWCDQRYRGKMVAQMKGENLLLHTSDGVRLDAVWVERNPGGPCAVLLHPNGDTLEAMLPAAKWYRRHGMNVFLLTIRGYPGSEGDAVKEVETGLYRDLAASMNFLAEKGIRPEQTLVHGLSLGGSLAAAAAYYYGTHATLDQTFSSAQNIMHHMGRRFCPTLPEPFSHGVHAGTFSTGKEVKLPKGQQDRLRRPIYTDGLNTEYKLRDVESQVFLIRACADELIPSSCAESLFEARYGEKPKEGEEEALKDWQTLRAQRLFDVRGFHCTPFLKEQPQVSRHYLERLRELGLAAPEKSREKGAEQPLMPRSGVLEVGAMQRERESVSDSKS